MTVRVRDLSVIRAGGSASLIAFSVGFEGVPINVALVPQSIVAAGGTPPYTFSAVGLPTGVTINPLTGSISGTPTVGGNFTATVTVTDSTGATVNVPAFFSIVIPELIAFSVGFQDIRADVALTPQFVVASGGVPAYTWSAVGLPTGVTINAATGEITGTPTVSGTFTATVTVTDSLLTFIDVPVFFSIVGDDLFEDTFLNADQPFYVGTEWLCTTDPGYGTAWTGAQLGGWLNRNAVTGLTIQNNSGASFLPRVYIMPQPLSWALVEGQNQFAEYIVTADNSVGGSLTRIGPCVLTNPNAGTCYHVEIQREIPFALYLERWNAGAGAALFTSAANAFAFGDRITLTVSITAGVPTLAVLVNGVSVGGAVDNSGSQYTNGMPGIFSLGASAGRAQSLNTFRGGSLARL